MKSLFLNLNSQDLVKGLVVAVIMAVLASVEPILSTGAFPTIIQMKTIAAYSIGAGAAYLIKNLFTNSSDQLMKKE